MTAKADFSELEPYLEAWGLPTVEERILKRTSSTLEDMQAFHDAMVPRLAEIIDFLNQYPVDEIPPEHQRLKNATLSLIHIDRPVNKWKKVFLEGARDPRLFKMKSSFYDSSATD